MTIQTPNFIEEYSSSVSAIDCVRLIQLFETKKDLHVVGMTTQGFKPENKDDTEICITQGLLESDEEWSDAIQPVLSALSKNLDEYKKKYATIDDIDSWSLEPNGFNFQKFLPNQGYKQWHCEGGSGDSSKRSLVWMLYLITVQDKGGTDFHYQNYTCKAEVGKMVIWPPFWTHFHKSQVSPSELKYIMTGWMSYV